jgi:hypothetical protein
MLHVVEHPEEDEFGNVPPDGGVLVVGFDYTLWTGPLYPRGETGPSREGFTPWSWVVMTSGPEKQGRLVEGANDSVFVPEDAFQSKAVLLCAIDVAKRLAFRRTVAVERAVELEQAAGLDRDTARRGARRYETVAEAERLSEWADSVETYLRHQRWLCGFPS